MPDATVERLVLSSSQREILQALANHWELIRWRCSDGRQRWHLEELEYDGRSIDGLRSRGLIAPGERTDRLVLSDSGRRALTADRQPADEPRVGGGR